VFTVQEYGRPTDVLKFKPLRARPKVIGDPKTLKLPDSDYSHQVALIVPSTRCVSRPLKPKDFHARVAHTSRLMNYMFGGTTHVSSYGTWGHNKKIVGENNAVVFSFMPKERLAKWDEAFFKKAKQLAVDWRQASVAVIVDGKSYLVNHPNAETLQKSCKLERKR
jgi:hypothetical protein